MINSTRVLLCTSLLVAAAFPVRGWAGPDLQSRLLTEPMWTLQPADGPATQVWFEETEGAVQMVRCGAIRPECRTTVGVNTNGIIVKGVDARAVRLALVSANVPIFSGSGARLFPAWVVPSSQSRTGH
jgi:hypothetical protein